MFEGKDMNKAYIIAEAGVNHNGDIKTAYKLVDAAKAAGADAVKFQTFKSEKLVSKSAQKADYQKKTTSAEESQAEMLKKLELSEDEYIDLKRYCDDIGIQFLSTPFDEDSVDFLNGLGVPIMKIPSGEITNLPLLIKIAQTGKKVIISTGMCEMDEIQAAIDVLEKNGAKEITVLHCNTEYPTPFEDVNLSAMHQMEKILQKPIGYSDHTRGIEIPIAAVALGASVIEKHFTLDRNMEGPDHKASLEPNELKSMVEAVRNVETALGSGEKKPSESEKKNIYVARKSIVASRKIHEGEIFTQDNLATKRPGNGISPMCWENVIGKRAKRDFGEDELIEL